MADLLSPYLFVMAVLLGAAVALRWIPTRRAEPTDIDPCEAAYLRGGRRSAVRVALVMSYGRGAITVGRRGTMRRDKALRGDVTPLERAANATLYESTGFRMLLVRPSVDRALKDLKGRLITAGLLHPYWGAVRAALGAMPILGLGFLADSGWAPLKIAAVTTFLVGAGAVWRLPHRTRAARRLLQALQERHPPLAKAGGSIKPAPYDLGMTLAIYGPAALPKLAANFVREAGLFGRKWVGDDWAGNGPAPENRLVNDAFIAGDYDSGGGNGLW